MDEETLKGATAELATPTLQEVSGINASLTEEGKVPSGLLLGFGSNDPEIRKRVVVKIRKTLQKLPSSRFVQAVVDTGLVPDLVSLLDSDDTELQGEAACIVANIASGTTQQTEKVIDAGAIPKLARLAASPNEDVSDNALARLAASPNEDVSDNAVWALANIAGDSAILRDRVEDEGGINALVTILNHEDLGPTNTQRSAVWAISCYLQPWPSRRLPVTRVKQLLPCLVRYILKTPVDEANMESLEYAVQSLERIYDHGLERSDVVKTEMFPRLAQLLADSSSSVPLQKQALKCFGYLVSGNEDDTDVAVNAGLLPALSVALAAGNQQVCEFACWTASNITAGNQRQVQAFLDSGLLEPVIRILMDAQNSTKTRREACWVLSNLTKKIFSHKEGQSLIERRCPDGLAAALLIPDRQSKERAALGISNILKRTGSQGLEGDSSPLAILRSASCPQNLRAVRDSRELQDIKLKKDCHDILTRYFPEYSRRGRV
ncbi:Importin subunit alpha-4 [Tulasnella sp. 424]|nr:Importin subunit alpha-4 [Tulasnella sp. 424]